MEALLRQIQKYVSGKIVYIPAREEKQSWGETSGYKRYIYERNCEIKAKFKTGAGIETLAEEYFLSPESIKRIVYAKRRLLCQNINVLFPQQWILQNAEK